METNGNVRALQDTRVNPTNLEGWRDWERFEVVDAGDGKYGFHNTKHNRFLRLAFGDVNGYGGQMNVGAMPQNWGAERFRVMNAGGGGTKVAFHTSGRFMRMKGGEVDGKGGDKAYHELPPESVWGSERWQIILHPKPHPHPHAPSSSSAPLRKTMGTVACSSIVREIVLRFNSKGRWQDVKGTGSLR